MSIESFLRFFSTSFLSSSLSFLSSPSDFDLFVYFFFEVSREDEEEGGGCLLASSLVALSKVVYRLLEWLYIEEKLS